MNSLPILYSLALLMSYEKLAKSSSSSEKVFVTQLLSLKELDLGFQLRMPPVGTLKQECSKTATAFKQDSSLQDKLEACKRHGKLTTTELKILEEIITILQTFIDATDEWQRDSESIGSVIPAYCHMRNTLLDCTRVGSKVTTCKKFAKTLLNSLETRLAYVLTDTFYILGIISPLSLLFLLSNFDFII